MKKLFFIFLILFLTITFAGPSFADQRGAFYYIYLGSAQSGATPAPSGVSYMVVSGKGISRSSGTTVIKIGETNGIISLQLDPRYGPTIATNTGGDDSGVSFDVRALTSIIDSGDIFGGASPYTTRFTLGGNTPYVYSIEPDQWVDKLSFQVQSGITPLSQLRLLVVVR